MTRSFAKPQSLGILMLLPVLLALLAFPARTQDAMTPIPAEWQAVITGQIDAFHAGDAAGALVFAASGFKETFDDPADFIRSIEIGYDAILRSQSHTFGTHQIVEEGVVLQIVWVVGPDQILYEALYRLGLEEDGWRIQGVAIRRDEGMAA